MKKYFFAFCILHLLFVNNELINANDKNQMFALHIKSGYNLSFFNNNFQKFEGISNCGTFETGSGGGLYGSLFFEKNISNYISAHLGLSFIQRNGKLIAPTQFYVRNNLTGNVDKVETNNIIELNSNYLEFQPQISTNLTKNFINGPLKAHLGLRIFIPIQTNYNYFETIVSPSDAVFINQNNQTSQTRQISSGDIKNIKSPGYGLSVGLENLLKSGNDNYFTQNIQFDYNLSSFINDGEINVYSIRLGIGYRFGIKSAIKPPVNPPKPILEPPVAKPIEEKPIYVEQKEELNINIASANIKRFYGKELLSTIPIVNAVFFAQNSATIPEAYKYELPEKSFFEINAVEAHNYLFPRIAEIIKKNPNAKIELVGSTSGKTDEQDFEKLAKDRAIAVKNALIRCGISEKKISYKTQELPEVISNLDFSEGVSENRRVDIKLINAPMQEYVDFLSFQESKGTINLSLETKGFMPNEQLIVSSSFLNEPLSLTLANNKSAKDINIPFKSRIETGKVNYEFYIQAKMKNTVDTVKFEFNADELKSELVEQNVSNFKAILRFDYNSSVLNAENKALLKQLAEKLPSGLTINILGSADALGTQMRNEKLISDRANLTREYLDLVAPRKFKFNIGINKEKFPEETPQGRFLNRSILITISN